MRAARWQIGVLGIALIGGAAWMVSPFSSWRSGESTSAAISQSMAGCRHVRLKADLWRQNVDAAGCPTLPDLVNARLLSSADERDWWGVPYAIHCVPGQDIYVSSAGRDKIMGTADDLRDDMPPAEVERVKRLYMQRALPRKW